MNASSVRKDLLRNIVRQRVRPSQLLVLMEVRDHPGRTSREIADRCHLDPSNVSHRLDYLAKTGDVVKTGSRPCVHYLSKQGRDFFSVVLDLLPSLFIPIFYPPVFRCVELPSVNVSCQ